MLANTITLSVDEANNNGTPVETTLSRYVEEANRSTYVTATHLPGDRDQVAFARAFPKKSGNFKGVSKSSVKFTRDVIVQDAQGNDILVPMIHEYSCSLPVGVELSAVVRARQRMVSLLDDDTVMNMVQVQQQI